MFPGLWITCVPWISQDCNCVAILDMHIETFGDCDNLAFYFFFKKGDVMYVDLIAFLVDT